MPRRPSPFWRHCRGRGRGQAEKNAVVTRRRSGSSGTVSRNSTHCNSGPPSALGSTARGGYGPFPNTSLCTPCSSAHPCPSAPPARQARRGQASLPTSGIPCMCAMRPPTLTQVLTPPRTPAPLHSRRHTATTVGRLPTYRTIYHHCFLALPILVSRPPPRRSEAVQRYGKALINLRPEEATRLIMDLCTQPQHMGAGAGPVDAGAWRRCYGRASSWTCARSRRDRGRGSTCGQGQDPRTQVGGLGRCKPIATAGKPTPTPPHHVSE